MKTSLCQPEHIAGFIGSSKTQPVTSHLDVRKINTETHTYVGIPRQNVDQVLISVILHETIHLTTSNDWNNIVDNVSISITNQGTSTFQTEEIMAPATHIAQGLDLTPRYGVTRSIEPRRHQSHFRNVEDSSRRELVRIPTLSWLNPGLINLV